MVEDDGQPAGAVGVSRPRRGQGESAGRSMNNLYHLEIPCQLADRLRRIGAHQVSISVDEYSQIEYIDGIPYTKDGVQLMADVRRWALRLTDGSACLIDLDDMVFVRNSGSTFALVETE